MEPTVNLRHRSNKWTAAYWFLFALFLTTAFTTMAGISAGLFSSYAADIGVPALLYISLRSLHRRAPSAWPLCRIFGRIPEVTALTLVIGSSATEISQYYWPSGVFAGTFDPWDLVAYAVGVAVPYAVDRHELSLIARRDVV